MKRWLLTIQFYTMFLLHTTAQGPPIFTDTPIMLGLEGRGIRTFGRYVNKEKGSAYMQPIAIPYNVSRTFQVGGIMPLVGMSPNNMDDNFGLGDMKLFTKLQIHQKDSLWQGYLQQKLPRYRQALHQHPYTFDQ